MLSTGQNIPYQLEHDRTTPSFSKVAVSLLTSKDLEVEWDGWDKMKA